MILVGVHQQRTVMVAVGLTQFRSRSRNFFAVQENIVARRDFSVNSIFSIDRSRDQIQVVLAVVAFAGREEGAIKIVAIVINGPAAAVSPRQLNASVLKLSNVCFVERILMSPDNHARVVQPQHENVMISKVVVFINPIFESKVRENIVGLRDKNRLADGIIFSSCRIILLSNGPAKGAPNDAEKALGVELLQYICAYHLYHFRAHTGKMS